MLQGYDSLYYGYSSLDGSVVVRILKVVLKEFNMSMQSVVYRVTVCFGYWLLTCVSITCLPSQQSLSTLSVSCRMPISREDEKKMLPEMLLKMPQGPVRYRPKIPKHVPDAIFYLW